MPETISDECCCKLGNPTRLQRVGSSKLNTILSPTPPAGPSSFGFVRLLAGARTTLSPLNRTTDLRIPLKAKSKGYILPSSPMTIRQPERGAQAPREG